MTFKELSYITGFGLENKKIEYEISKFNLVMIEIKDS